MCVHYDVYALCEGADLLNHWWENTCCPEIKINLCANFLLCIDVWHEIAVLFQIDLTLSIKCKFQEGKYF